MPLTAAHLNAEGDGEHDVHHTQHLVQLAVGVHLGAVDGEDDGGGQDEEQHRDLEPRVDDDLRGAVYAT